MKKQAQDFLDESAALQALLSSRTDRECEVPTQFKGWSIDDVLQHLHVWNCAAVASARNEREFETMMTALREAKTMRAFEKAWIGDVRGGALRVMWWEGAQLAGEVFRAIDPKQRLTWVGPPMSARSSITARQMETWAHGQAVFDLLGVERSDHDRLRNIAHLGVNTFGWTFAVRGREPPGPAPCVALVAPSGESWTWNDHSTHGRVSGTATEFCQVVTQTRNVADTGLRVEGPIAHEWMSVAQCFAGAASAPPAPGTRFPRLA